VGRRRGCPAVIVVVRFHTTYAIVDVMDEGFSRSFVDAVWLLGAWGVGGEGLVLSLGVGPPSAVRDGVPALFLWWSPLFPGLLASAYRPLRIVRRLVSPSAVPFGLGICRQLTG
jgi:hypothetical protein